jgi:putative ABC transport system permease protein
MILAQVRLALRVLRKNPGFATAAVVALGAGIGANTAMFSVVDGVLLRPLPYPQPEQLVLVRSTLMSKSLDNIPHAAGDYFDFAQQNRVFTAMAAYLNVGFGLSTPNAEPERYAGVAVTEEYFRVFQVQPALGRVFSKEESQPGKDAVVVLSHGLWQERFGGRQNVLGETLELNGRTRVVVGIAPPGFAYPETARLWVPAVFEGQNRTRRDLHNLNAVARLKSGVAVTTAQANLQGIATQLARAYPEFDAEKGVVVKPMLDAAVGGVRPALLVLLGAVGFVLAIACANVANLLLARGASRTQEMAIRAALGAKRSNLIQQLLIESVVLAMAGGVLGLGIAYSLFRALKWLAPAGLPRLETVSLDQRTLVFTLLAALLTGLLFGLVPALRLSVVDLHGALKERLNAGTARGRLRQALVVAQIAFALVLLAGAGLLMRSFYELRSIDLGFNPEQLLTLRMSLLPSKYNGHEDQQYALVRRIQEQVGNIAGVRSVGVATDLPLLGSPSFIMRFEGRPPVTVANAPVAAFATVTPTYFSAMGTRLKGGRVFDDHDGPSQPLVCVINETLAKQHFGAESPIGKRLEIGFSDPPRWRQIVGIVEDLRNDDVAKAPKPQVYGAYFQQPGVLPAAPPLSIAVRTAGDPALLATAVRKGILAVDSSQPVYAVQTMATVVSDNLAQKRFALLLMGLFAGIALLLAAIGLAGVISYMVAQRTREIGIRMALGAQPQQVLRMVESEALRMAAVGGLVGILGALALGQSLSTMLYGVSPRDPVTLGTVAAALMLIALAAAFVPAFRATRISPVVALREE